MSGASRLVEALIERDKVEVSIVKLLDKALAAGPKPNGWNLWASVDRPAMLQLMLELATKEEAVEALRLKLEDA